MLPRVCAVLGALVVLTMLWKAGDAQAGAAGDAPVTLVTLSQGTRRLLVDGSAARTLSTADSTEGAASSQAVTSVLTYLGTGYNLLKGCPIDVCYIGFTGDNGLTQAPIFALQAGQYNFTEASACASVTQELTKFSASDASRTASTKLGASIGYGAVAFSSSSEFTSAASTQDTLNTVSVTSTATCQSHTGNLHAAVSSLTLSAYFHDAAVLLIHSMDNPDFPTTFKVRLSGLVNAFGTHYVYQAQFGGISVLSMSLKSSSVAKLKSQGFKWAVAAKADFLGLTSSTTVENANSATSRKEWNMTEKTIDYVCLPADNKAPQVALTGATDFSSWATAMRDTKSPAIITYQILETASLFQVPELWLTSNVTASQLDATRLAMTKALTACGGPDDLSACVVEVCVDGSYSAFDPKTKAMTCRSCYDYAAGPVCSKHHATTCTATTCGCQFGWMGLKCRVQNFGSCGGYWDENHCVGPTNNKPHFVDGFNGYNACTTDGNLEFVPTVVDDQTSVRCNCQCRSGQPGTLGFQIGCDHSSDVHPSAPEVCRGACKPGSELVCKALVINGN